ncbi:porin [Piscinibacter sakaiensis]|uniref:Porin n=1 Tax=Piscinibacter sakaiensis TaxID=1547922 RepID=A0A0K8P6H2_PISS1|nr:porin [Piscinibacter sakaiensis]GAP38197.1 porin [Piscinibacter sakaiensis]
MNSAAARVALASLLPLAAQAQSNVNVYAVLDVSPQLLELKNAPAGDQHVVRLYDNSQIGFRGREDLGSGLAAFWQIEYAVSAAKGSMSPNFRNTGIGLSSPGGTLLLGHWDTPYKISTILVDPFFNTRLASYINITGGNSSVTGNNLAARQSFARRQNNMVQYWSPDFSGVSVRLGTSMSEETSAPGSPRLLSAALHYRQGPLFLTYGLEQHRDYGGAGNRDLGQKVGATYDWQAWTFALTYERLKWRGGTLSELVKGVTTPAGTSSVAVDSVFAAVTRRIGAHALIATLGKDSGLSANGRRIGQSSATALVLNYTYNFSKNTSVYTEFTQLRNQANSANNYAIIGWAGGVPKGADLQSLSLGLKSQF